MHRQVGVHLDDAAVAALVPVVATPGFVTDELDLEPLAGGQRDSLSRLAPALGDGRVEHRPEAVSRHDELLAESVEPVGKRPVAWHQRLELRDRVGEVRLGMGGRHRVVERGRLLVEREATTGELFDPRHDGAHLSAQEHEARLTIGISCGFSVEVGPQALAAFEQDVERHPRGGRFVAPRRRSIVRVDIGRIVLADGQHETDVAFGDGLHHAGALADA